MSSLFGNHSSFTSVLKHNSLPIYLTDEFTFYRCVNVGNWLVYGKTISRLHSGNLRMNNIGNRYSKLFPNEKTSYWADSKATALAEIRKHGGNKDYLTFIAYDDVSSTFPMLNIDESLVIVDGRAVGFKDILIKIEEDKELTANEIRIVELIHNERPDCLAYESVAKDGGLNYLFFEKGFQKLALREVSLYYGERKSKNVKRVSCAITSDYWPVLENYGKCFEPIVKVRTDSEYTSTEEFRERRKNYDISLRRING